MNKLMCILLCLTAAPIWAEDFLGEVVSTELDREPAATAPISAKRSYPGGIDEEDLRVQPYLPEASLKADARSVQREVYKALYNQELKDDRHDPVEE